MKCGKRKSWRENKENGYYIPPPLSFPRLSLSLSHHVFLSFSFYSSCICEKLDSVGLSIVDRNKNFLRLPFELMSVGLHAEEHARK